MTIRVEDGLLRLLLLIIRLLFLSFLIIVQVWSNSSASDVAHVCVVVVELSSDGKAICKYANKYCFNIIHKYV